MGGGRAVGRIDAFKREVAVVDIGQSIERSAVDAVSVREGIVAKAHRVVNRLLERLHLTTIQIGAAIVAKAPDDAHERVGVLAGEELVTAHPFVFHAPPARHDVVEEQAHVRDVVHMIVLIFVHGHCRVRHGATTTTKVVEVRGAGQLLHEPFGYLIFAAHVGQAVLSHCEVLRFEVLRL